MDIVLESASFLKKESLNPLLFDYEIIGVIFYSSTKELFLAILFYLAIPKSGLNTLR